MIIFPDIVDGNLFNYQFLWNNSDSINIENATIFQVNTCKQVENNTTKVYCDNHTQEIKGFIHFTVGNITFQTPNISHIELNFSCTSALNGSQCETCHERNLKYFGLCGFQVNESIIQYPRPIGVKLYYENLYSEYIAPYGCDKGYTGNDCLLCAYNFYRCSNHSTPYCKEDYKTPVDKNDRCFEMIEKMYGVCYKNSNSTLCDVCYGGYQMNENKTSCQKCKEGFPN